MFSSPIEICMMAGIPVDEFMPRQPQIDFVKHLNGEEIKEFLQSNDFVLIHFQLSSNPYNAQLKHELNEMEKWAKSKNLPLVFADIDIEDCGEIAETYSIDRNRTSLKFFNRGVLIGTYPHEYWNDVMFWCQRKICPPVQPVEKIEEILVFLDDSDSVVVGFFEDFNCPGARKFISAAINLYRHDFAITKNPSLRSEYKVQDGDAIILKKVEERLVTFRPETQENLENFIRIYSTPLFDELCLYKSRLLQHDAHKIQLMLLISDLMDYKKLYIDPLRDLAREFRERVLFVVVNGEDETHERIFSSFGLTTDDVPNFRLLHLSGPLDDGLLYRPENEELTPENVRTFLDDYFAKRLVPYRASQKLSKDWDQGPVKELVGDNFEEVALDRNKDVLVEFYNPADELCLRLEKIYMDIGKAFQDDETVLVCRIDALGNEIDDAKFEKYPAFRLYKKETNEFVDFNNVPSFKNLKNFISSGGNNESEDMWSYILNLQEKLAKFQCTGNWS